MLPSEVLSYANLRASYFGVPDGTVDVDGVAEPIVDQPDNVVYNTVSAAKLAFDRIVLDQSDSTRAQLALIYFTLAHLYGVLADEKGLFVGLVTQRGGQVSTPLGSFNELMKAAQRNYQNARNLYPDIDWPPLDPEASGGSVSVPRSYVP